jgi:predicted deacylase
LITAGVHGDEFTPMAAVRKLARRVEPDALRGTLRLVPVVNEAAYLRGERTAEDGHDLARVCPGNPDGSVTLRTAFALSQLIGETDYYIDLHTGSATLAVLPMTGYTLHTDARILERQREMASAFNLPVVWGTTPTLDGRSLSVARDTGVPAIYAEYLGSGVCDPEGVEAYVSGSLNVMAQLGMIDRKPPESQVELIVEDDGPQSGHMQVQNNSPVTGFFEPTVCLGQTIETGSLIGTVVDVAGSEAAKIQAQYDGIVLALRTFPRVLQGDSVAVIMNTAGNRTSWSGGLA